MPNTFLENPPGSASETDLHEKSPYHALSETIPVQIWTATPEGKLDYVSEQTARVLGRPAEQILAEGWQTVVHPEDLPLAIERWVHSLTTAVPYETEFRLRLSNGVYNWHLARAVPQLDAEGNVVRWFGTNTDIESERQQRSRVQELLKALEQQAALLEERNHLLALEAELGVVLASEQSLEQVLSNALPIVARHLDVVDCGVWLADSAVIDLELVATARRDALPAGLAAQELNRHEAVARSADTRQQTVIEGAPSSQIPAEEDWLHKQGVVSFVVSPLLIGEVALGVIGVWARVELSVEALAVLRAVSSSLARAVDRHRIAERIRRSEAWLSTTLSSIGDGVIATDVGGVVTYLNPVAEKMTGWSRSVCLGRHLDEVFCIVNETSRKPVESPVAKVLREGGIVGMANHTVLLRPDGSELSIEDSAAPIRDEDGTLSGVVLVFRDATAPRAFERERVGLLEVSRAAQRDAKEARDQLHSLLMQAPSPICVLRGPDHTFELANPSYIRLVGGRDIVGRPVREALPELVGQGFYELLDRVFTTGDRYEGKDVPANLQREDGELGEDFVDFIYEPLLDTQGKVDGVLVLATEVTEKVVARRALEVALAEADRLNRDLREAESMLRSLVDNLPELAWSAQADGYIDFYNRRWYDYTGTTPENMLGWGWTSVHDPATLEQVIEHWKHSIESGERFEMEFPLRRGDGKFRWFLTRGEPLRDSSGKIVRWFGTNTDIHDQREEGQRAMEANLAKDEFLATASHELRNPLSAILGWARLLRGADVSPSMQARGLETIERNANAQVKLIEDILDGSRMMAGKLRLEVVPLDLAQLVHSALETVRPAADAKKIHIATTFEAASARMVGDPERLQQIIWNLVTNAVKFTPPGGKIVVELQRTGSQLELTVSDSGEGIAADFLPHIFERFRQADGSPTRRHGGLGLGLALVRHLVEAHGGTVEVQSEGLGLGAQFLVRLPVLATYLPEETAGGPLVEETDDGGAILKDVEILVVDDEADGRDLVATVLRLSGARVRTAGSAEEALELLRQTPASVIVSDIGMPGIDGYEFIRRVRALPQGAGLKVRAVALTAYVRDLDRSRAFEAGFQNHLSKPVEPAELLRVVAELVRR